MIYCAGEYSFDKLEAANDSALKPWAVVVGLDSPLSNFIVFQKPLLSVFSSFSKLFSMRVRGARLMALRMSIVSGSFAVSSFTFCEV